VNACTVTHAHGGGNPACPDLHRRGLRVRTMSVVLIMVALVVVYRLCRHERPRNVGPFHRHDMVTFSSTQDWRYCVNTVRDRETGERVKCPHTDRKAR
jgi:hypothetical protein